MSLFKNPENLSDKELEDEIQAINRVYDEFMSSDVSDYIKGEFLEHVFNVEREQRYRDNGEIIFPLTSFGVVDF